MGKERKVVNLDNIINQKDTPPVRINTETSQATIPITGVHEQYGLIETYKGCYVKIYRLKKAEHGINFKYNGKQFSFYVKDVLVFPQDYAAAVVFKGDILSQYSTCYCIDIGDGTTDMVGIVDGMPEKDTMLSREIGMSKLRSRIIDDIINDYQVTLTDRNVEDYLSGKNVILPPDEAEAIKDRIDKIAMDFTTELVNQLHSKVPDFRTTAIIFSGGGAMALRKYLEKTKAFGFTYYIEDINANAVGYQQLAKMQLGIE